jgi:hypothetical protein
MWLLKLWEGFFYRRMSTTDLAMYCDVMYFTEEYGYYMKHMCILNACAENLCQLSSCSSAPSWSHRSLATLVFSEYAYVVCIGIGGMYVAGIEKTCSIFDRCEEERHAHELLCFHVFTFAIVSHFVVTN